MKRRILVILPRIPLPARDGAEVVMSETLAAFRRQGLEVDVFALNPSRQHRDPSNLDPLCKAHEVADIATDVRLIPLAVSLITSPSIGLGKLTLPVSYWLMRFIDKQVVSALRKFVDLNGPYDVVHCETLFTVYYGLFLASVSPRTKVVYRSHNVEWRIQDRLSQEAGTNLLERAVRARLAHQTKRFEERAVELVNAVACISEQDQQWYSLASPKVPVQTLFPGIREYPDYQRAPVGSTIGFLGSLDWEPNRRGVAWFIEHVWPRIKQQIPDAQFEIAGRGSNSFCAALNLPDGAVCAGEVDSVEEFYRRQAILVSPLFSGSGVRVKLLESFACGKAVVTTAQGAEGLHSSPTQICAIADTPEQFSDACLSLLADTVRRQQLAQSAQAYVREHYSWNAAVEGFERLYR
jgi:glycosyltransferase involved in cell wall biosynthesis